MTRPQRLVSALLAITAAVSLGGAALSQSEPLRWTSFSTPQGTRAEMPAGLFSHDDGPYNVGTGRQFSSDDGRSHLAVYTLPNDDRETPAAFLRRNFPKSRAVLDYDRVTPTFFAVSTNEGDAILYKRCNFTQAANPAIHCISMKYPRQEKRAWDGIVTRISLSLRPLERSSAAAR